MSPLSPRIISRIDPRYPLLWRDEQSVQFGLEGVIRVSLHAYWVEPLLQRLRSGIRLSTFDLVAHGVGAPRDEARALLDQVRPLLVPTHAAENAVWVEGVNVTDQRAVPRLRDALHDEGLPTAHRGDRGAVGVVVVEGVAAALQLTPYLREDIAHLPVAFERGATTVGPLVIPGETPCLSCRDASETARDDAWPLLHAQLVGSSPGPISAVRVAEAATLVTRVLRAAPVRAGLVVRLRPDGRQSWHSVAPHEECQCLGLSSRSPQGNETASARPVRPIATTTSRPYARPA